MTNWINDIRKFHETFPKSKYAVSCALSASSGFGTNTMSYEKLMDMIAKGNNDGVFTVTQQYPPFDKIKYPFYSVYPV